MSVLNEVVSKEEQEEVHPLILKNGKDVIIVRVPHTSLEKFKKSLTFKLPFLKIVLVSGTLKSIRERMGLTKDDLETA
jgi:predicted dinucleotide-utilizing enzyme